MRCRGQRVDRCREQSVDRSSGLQPVKQGLMAKILELEQPGGQVDRSYSGGPHTERRELTGKAHKRPGSPLGREAHP